MNEENLKNVQSSGTKRKHVDRRESLIIYALI